MPRVWWMSPWTTGKIPSSSSRASRRNCSAEGYAFAIWHPGVPGEPESVPAARDRAPGGLTLETSEAYDVDQERQVR